ncbi:Crp/Fnr family transcriptional regulator [Gloeobacter kilaueensis]|uniref:Crp/Fnr family transcriptional regulator n=1 Tax=Gloeobacter kilaueensis (strain ATCC BAA-2537 / CCAP 1431/1 / ULC 316 / JS1) TaxID=1183438 RepID=U5QKG9_GLOK1|nr:Crp/Fnr family transcriptional regulator [Gloeobacter kilaueensis]AGY59348.1 Crp/Fnr family transcriptional regulator [Gloeobacter kilaueensis JS1]
MATSIISTAYSRTHTFERRALLPHERDCLWQLVQGIVRATTWHENGTLISLGLWGPGDVVGRELVQVEPYHLECLTPVVAVRVPKDQWSRLTDALIRHVRGAMDLLEIVQCKDAQVCIESVLVWLARRFGCDVAEGRLIDLRLTHQDLADLVGTSRVTVTRILNQLERQGRILRVARHRLILRPTTAAPCVLLN